MPNRSLNKTILSRADSPASARGSILAATILAAAILLTGNWAPAAEDTPQLRIDIGAHTAAIRDLAFLPDGKRIATASLDKEVRIWRLDGLNENAESWALERCVRWEVGQGLRGAVYALAVNPKNEIVMGGYGYRGSLGELITANANGDFLRSDYESHQQSIADLAFDGPGDWLISADLSGRVLASPTNKDDVQWVIKPSDRHKMGLRPIAVGGGRVFTARFSSRASNNTPIWEIHSLDLRQLANQPTTPEADASALGEKLPQPHFGQVTALAASANGAYLASADLARRLYLWDLKSGGEPQLLSSDWVVTSLAFAPDNQTLAVGTSFGRGNQTGTQLQLWDVAKGRLRTARTLEAPVLACAFSPDGKRVAYSGSRENRVSIDRLDAMIRSQVGGSHQVQQVAFVDDKNSHRLLIKASLASVPTTASIEFNWDGLRRRQVATAAALPPTAFADGWTATIDRGANRMDLRRRDQLATITLNRATQGNIQCYCWVPDKDGAAAAIAVGTDVHNGVYVYDLNTRELVRFFRGHTGAVTSLSASPDCRYLASSGRDGSVRLWELSSLRAMAGLERKWGLELVIENGRLRVKAVDDLGPLFYKDVRAGDWIDELVWRENGENLAEREPAAILRRLAELPWNTQVGFRTSRGPDQRPVFQQVAAWPSVASLFMSERDWIAWTPTGYYACSAGGERLIGWQVNQGLGPRPLYFPAVRFNKSLHRPDAIRQLLKTGSLRAALAARGEPLRSVAEVLPPKLEIKHPATRRIVLDKPQFEITAQARTVGAHPVRRMRVLINGSPPQELARGIRREAENEPEQEWTVAVPPGVHRIRVMADSDVSQSVSEEVIVEYQPELAKPALHMLAIGIASYPGRLALDYPNTDAEMVTGVFQQRSTQLFENINIKLIQDDKATRDGIEEGLDWLQSQMKTGDLGLVFFAGHGIRDDKHFYLLPVDVDRNDLEGTSVSSERLKTFCRDIGGRGNLIVMLDACHSGAVRLEQLALTLSRPEFGVVVMTSSTGEEKSFESSKWSAGAFSKALTEGLHGEADRFGADKRVRYNELGAYVHVRVQELTKNRQTPLLASPGIPPFPLSVAP